MTIETRILTALKAGPMTVAEICVATNLTSEQVAPPMSALYHRGKVTREKVRVDGIGRPRFRYTRADAPAT